MSLLTVNYLNNTAFCAASIIGSGANGINSITVKYPAHLFFM